jgi:hypothetical protein
VRWYNDGAAIARRHPIEHEPEGTHEFCDFILKIIRTFADEVEVRDGWKLLYNDNGQPRSENTVQRLFRSVVTHYCRALNIDLSPESNAGRGPVDFKFSRGWASRGLVEVKLIRNSHLLHGLSTQTPLYLRAEGVACAYFMAVGFNDSELEPERTDKIFGAAAAVSRSLGPRIHPVIVDARRKPSASKA